MWRGGLTPTLLSKRAAGESMPNQQNRRSHGPPVAPSLNLQPFLADGRVRPEFRGRALEHDAAVAHHIEPVRYPHRDRQLLLHQQDGDAAPGDFGNEVADLLHDPVSYTHLTLP